MNDDSKILISCLILIFVQRTFTTCGQCGSRSGVACLTRNTFSFCTNGTFNSTTNFTCPSQTYCSNTPDVCTSPSMSTAECPNLCNMCSWDNRFACLNSTTYALCYGSTSPSSATGTCPTNQYCDTSVKSPNFCGSDSSQVCLSNSNGTTTTTTTALSSTSSTTASSISSTTTTASSSTSSSTASSISSTTTTASSSTSSTTASSISSTSTSTRTAASTTTPAPNLYCQSINARGGTRYAAPYITGCRRYVYCFTNGGTRNGAYYDCSGSTLFNNVTGYCVPSSGFTCPANQ